jgi:hypothetical protein
MLLKLAHVLADQLAQKLLIELNATQGDATFNFCI